MTRRAIVWVGALAVGATGALLATAGACGGSPEASGFPLGDDASEAPEASAGDASTGATPGAGDAGGLFASDAAAPEGGDSLCDLGAAASFATNSDLNLFGQIVYYEEGGALPPGRYRATYVDGCMKYDFIFSWQVQGSTPDAGGSGFWFVGNTSDDRIAMAPGTTAAYADFDACVGANLAATPEEFEFDGGKLGVWLNDDPYIDNVAGENGRNPKWQLTLLGVCPPEFAPK